MKEPIEMICQGIEFDVVLIDAPWKQASSSPTRGLHLDYSQIPDKLLKTIQFGKVVESGFCFMWVVNNKLQTAMEWMYQERFRIVEIIVWMKQTANQKLAKTMGHFLQHSSEICLVGLKGTAPQQTHYQRTNNVIVEEVTAPSTKPKRVYEIIEKLVPNGKYIELFARLHNLRNKWVSVGDQLNDVEAYRP